MKNPLLLVVSLLGLLALPIRMLVSQDGLSGLWGGEAGIPRPLSGVLLLQRDGDSWAARTGGAEAMRRVIGDSVRLPFGAGLGELRIETSQPTVEAFWVQPAGSRPAYVTPVGLRRVGPDVWHGRVTPLEERFRLFLLLQRDSSGLQGALRNPEVNWGARWGSRLRLRVAGEDIVVLGATGQERMRAHWDTAGRRLLFDLDWPLVLRPLRFEEAIGFVPRAGAGDVAGYRRPARLDDGWQVGRGADVGIDESRLGSLVRLLAQADPVSDTAIRVHSLLIARHGTLILDEYFRGYTVDQPHDLRSASKTLLSVLYGAMAGNAPGLETTARSWFPDAAIDARITLRHLLTHTSGLACDDNDDASPGHEDRMQVESSDWYAYALALPQLRPPGESYAYCSAGINLAGGILARSTGAWLPALFDRHLFRPLGIDRWAINLMPTGQGYTGGGMHLRPRDLLKFGELFLRDGLWAGKRVIPSDWVRLSTSRQVDVPDGSSDGLAWHRHVLTVGDRSFESFEASGNGGQFLVVVPALDLAVVVTAGNYGQYGIWRKIRTELIPRHVLTAVDP